MNRIIAEMQAAPGTTLRLVQGDLTEEAVDAIVNAANEHLMHGGGVAGAIVRKGGKVIQEESNRIAPIPTGQAGVTSAGALPARYVIHAVGPVWGSGDEDRKLRSALENSLLRAHELGLQSVSIPAISSGIFGFPKDRCAEILLDAALDFIANHPDTSLREVRFCLYDEPTLTAFRKVWERRFRQTSMPPEGS
ncbi:MAG: macro domain-containing protein [Chthonomonadales bacterium]